jgi:hypothetical protein
MMALAKFMKQRGETFGPSVIKAKYGTRVAFEHGYIVQQSDRPIKARQPAAAVLSIAAKSIIHSAAENALFFGCFCLGVQHNTITTAVQPTPHVRASAAIIDLIAVADVESRFGAVPPDGAGDEPRRLMPVGSIRDFRRRVASRKPVQDSSSMKEVVDEGIDDNETRPDGEPTKPGSAGPYQQ